MSASAAMTKGGRIERRVISTLLVFQLSIMVLFESNVLAKEVDRSKKESWAVIQEAFGSHEPNIRETAATSVGEFGIVRAKKFLKVFLKDRDLFVRIAAAKALVDLGDESGFSSLEEILKNKAPSPSTHSALERLQAMTKGRQRALAAKALGQIGNRRVIKILREARNDEDPQVRDAAAVALARLGEREEIFIFASALKDNDVGVRIAATEALSEIQDKSTLRHLVNAMNDPDESVRSNAVMALAKMADPSTFRNLKRALADVSPLVRERAAMGIGRIGNKTGTPHLKSSINDVNAYVAIASAKALHQLGDPSGLPILLSALRYSDPQLRARACEALGAVEGEASLQSLIMTMKDPDLLVRFAAAVQVYLRLKKVQ